jgi:hypothetical protein
MGLLQQLLGFGCRRDAGHIAVDPVAFAKNGRFKNARRGHAMRNSSSKSPRQSVLQRSAGSWHERSCTSPVVGKTETISVAKAPRCCGPLGFSASASGVRHQPPNRGRKKPYQRWSSRTLRQPATRYSTWPTSPSHTPTRCYFGGLSLRVVAYPVAADNVKARPTSWGFAVFGDA